MANPQSLERALCNARGAARLLLSQLEYSGDRQAHPSREVYSAVVQIQEQMIGSRPIAEIVSTLERVAAQCNGKLAPLRHSVEGALVIARRG